MNTTYGMGLKIIIWIAVRLWTCVRKRKKGNRCSEKKLANGKQKKAHAPGSPFVVGPHVSWEGLGPAPGRVLQPCAPVWRGAHLQRWLLWWFRFKFGFVCLALFRGWRSRFKEIWFYIDDFVMNGFQSTTNQCPNMPPNVSKFRPKRHPTQQFLSGESIPPMYTAVVALCFNPCWGKHHWCVLCVLGVLL